MSPVDFRNAREASGADAAGEGESLWREHGFVLSPLTAALVLAAAVAASWILAMAGY